MIQRKTRHKGHIIKVMFLAAVARPRFNEAGECVFDGKIGLWPFTKEVAAKKNSCNRPKGTLETKCMNVTREVYQSFLIDRVLPAIYDRWPKGQNPRSCENVYIQHDNPPSHNLDNAFHVACNSNRRFKIMLKKHPANSPDTNVLDLGLFRALQTETWKLNRGNNIDELINNVQAAWNDYSVQQLDHIWYTHQTVLDAIITDRGDNSFDIPHVGKDALQRKNNLPDRLPVSAEARALLEEYRFI